MKTNFIYLATENEHFYKMTIFSIVSLITYYQGNINDIKILIFTDSNYVEKFLKDLPIDVEYMYLSSQEIENMMGSEQFIFRLKIGIIEKTASKYPQNNIFYADSDTFFFGNIAEVIQKLSASVAILHRYEFPMTYLGNFPPNDIDHFKKVYDFLSNQKIFIKNQEIISTPQTFDSWNAGVIGLHQSHFGWLSEVYEFTDQLYRATHSRVAEQIAFAYFLQKRTDLIDCEKLVYHYWHRVEKRIIREFLNKNLNTAFIRLSLASKKELTHKWVQYLLKKMPTHEYMHRYNAMIAFQERRYLAGYKETIKTLLNNPLQDLSFFKDVAYYTKKFFFEK